MTKWLPRFRLALAIGACLLTPILAGDWIARAQDQSAATAKDAIVARRTLMDFLSNAMDQIEKMNASGKIDLASGKKDADLISMALAAFPHLFPPSTNQWQPNVEPDPESGTIASPEVWQKFKDFYERATAASQTAYKLSHTDKEAEFKASAQVLRNACDSCHALYMKQ